jgi:hypothetical protein
MRPPGPHRGGFFFFSLLPREKEGPAAKPREDEGLRFNQCKPSNRDAGGEKPLTGRFAAALSRGRGLVGANGRNG